MSHYALIIFYHASMLTLLVMARAKHRLGGYVTQKNKLKLKPKQWKISFYIIDCECYFESLVEDKAYVKKICITLQSHYS
jgi:hypothetical protein